MKIFWLRFAIFSLLWMLIILLDSNQIPLSIVSFAIALGFYFILSLRKRMLIIYLCLTGMITFHGYFLTEESLLTMQLLFFCMADAGFRLKQTRLFSYLMVTSVLSVSFLWLKDGFQLEWVLMAILLSVLILIMNAIVMERQEQNELYEQLLGEYRKLKRMNMAGEQDARLQERTKIARDIHDSVGHRLTALIMKLEMLTIQHKNKHYDELKHMAKDSLEETRQAVKALQTEQNEGIATVIHLIRKLEAESHIQVQFTLKQGILSVPLSNEKSIVLYRVIQEALTNAMRHVQTREVQVTLGKSATGDVAFEITNAIFQPKPFTFGFGLTNMRNRLKDIDGTLHVYQTENQFVVAGNIPS
ncbi:sensor histidine kinase [Oceanobacillus saliphilus]|uniref:sensor histidine kinase n=1 Tax=Oceanobacillus saliphilus TaxID=2925834 RepID=UPI00201D87BC|nr:sensor histidine kinase [Oceanobacillus saliphilus]